MLKFTKEICEAITNFAKENDIKITMDTTLRPFLCMSNEMVMHNCRISRNGKSIHFEFPEIQQAYSYEEEQTQIPKAIAFAFDLADGELYRDMERVSPINKFERVLGQEIVDEFIQLTHNLEEIESENDMDEAFLATVYDEFTSDLDEEDESEIEFTFTDMDTGEVIPTHYSRTIEEENEMESYEDFTYDTSEDCDFSLRDMEKILIINHLEAPEVVYQICNQWDLHYLLYTRTGFKSFESFLNWTSTFKSQEDVIAFYENK